MAWSGAKAKQRFLELLSAAREPQTIEERFRAVAVVVAVESFEEFQASRAQRESRSVGEAFAELRSLVATSSYELELPRRRNRREGVTVLNPFS